MFDKVGVLVQKRTPQQISWSASRLYDFYRNIGLTDKQKVTAYPCFVGPPPAYWPFWQYTAGL